MRLSVISVGRVRGGLPPLGSSPIDTPPSCRGLAVWGRGMACTSTRTYTSYGSPPITRNWPSFFYASWMRYDWGDGSGGHGKLLVQLSLMHSLAVIRKLYLERGHVQRNRVLLCVVKNRPQHLFVPALKYGRTLYLMRPLRRILSIAGLCAVFLLLLVPISR